MTLLGSLRVGQYRYDILGTGPHLVEPIVQRLKRDGVFLGLLPERDGKNTWILQLRALQNGNLVHVSLTPVDESGRASTEEGVSGILTESHLLTFLRTTLRIDIIR
jgi:hypothetical protein